MSIIETEVGIPVLRPDWAAPGCVGAFFTLRAGGVSSGPYGGPSGAGGLNIGLHSGDARDAVLANRRIVAGLSGGSPRWLHQVHGTDVVPADGAAPEEEADGSWTRSRHVPCVVQTADCLPVLLAESGGGAVAALHAGWRGLAAGILQRGVATIASALPGGRIVAWLGPRIGVESFEVGPDVPRAMLRTLPGAEAAFHPAGMPGKWMADLGILARMALVSAGVRDGDIADCRLSTYTDPELFYSYRRDRGATGRHAALIWMA